MIKAAYLTKIDKKLVEHIVCLYEIIENKRAKNLISYLVHMPAYITQDHIHLLILVCEKKHEKIREHRNSITTSKIKHTPSEINRFMNELSGQEIILTKAENALIKIINFIG